MHHAVADLVSDNAQMDLALNIGNIYFIHEGIVPGYAAPRLEISGCFAWMPVFCLSGPSRESRKSSIEPLPEDSFQPLQTGRIAHAIPKNE